MAKKKTEKWRAIPYSASFEIAENGAIRNRKTRKIRASQSPITYPGSNGKYVQVPIWRVMQDVWPEVIP